MPLMRNPFRKTPNDIATDENGRPLPTESHDSPTTTPVGQRPGPLDIKGLASARPTEYKMSEINDSGVYLPPSPTEKPKFWSSRSFSSQTSSTHRSAVSESDNPFTISRESFDSYRRSFDISARSPVTEADNTRERYSLDARQARPRPPVLKDKQINVPDAYPEDRFEDVGLHDDVAKPKKQGIFSRFGHSSNDAAPAGSNENSRPSSSHFGSHMFGRRRGASGQGAELGSMQNPPQSIGQTPEVKVDK